MQDSSVLGGLGRGSGVGSSASKGSRSSTGHAIPRPNNVYTAMLVVSTAFMLLGTLFVAIRGSMLYDDFWSIRLFGG